MFTSLQFSSSPPLYIVLLLCVILPPVINNVKPCMCISECANWDPIIKTLLCRADCGQKLYNKSEK